MWPCVARGSAQTYQLSFLPMFIALQAALWLQGKSAELFGTDLHPSAKIGNGVQVRAPQQALSAPKHIPSETVMLHIDTRGTIFFLFEPCDSLPTSPHSSTMQRAL